MAEDEPQLRDLLTLILERSGFSLLIAKDAQEALEIANRHAHHIDLLVSDVQMPGMTGPDLAKELRRARPNLDVLLISGNPHAALILDKGWHFLEKPFQPNAILAKVRQIMNKSTETKDRG